MKIRASWRWLKYGDNDKQYKYPECHPTLHEAHKLMFECFITIKSINGSDARFFWSHVLGDSLVTTSTKPVWSVACSVWNSGGRYVGVSGLAGNVDWSSRLTGSSRDKKALLTRCFPVFLFMLTLVQVHLSQDFTPVSVCKQNSSQGIHVVQVTREHLQLFFT